MTVSTEPETLQSEGSPVSKPSSDAVNHPIHYGGKDNPYEAIKVIEAWALGFNLGNTVKYICRVSSLFNPGQRDIQDLKKARWYLDREIQWREGNQIKVDQS